MQNSTTALTRQNITGNNKTPTLYENNRKQVLKLHKTAEHPHQKKTEHHKHNTNKRRMQQNTLEHT